MIDVGIRDVDVDVVCYMESQAAIVSQCGMMG